MASVQQVQREAISANSEEQTRERDTMAAWPDHVGEEGGREKTSSAPQEEPIPSEKAADRAGEGHADLIKLCEEEQKRYNAPRLGKKKFDLIFALQESEELSEDWTDIYNTQALLSALILTLTFSPDGNRLSDEYADVNMWGSRTKDAIQVYQIILSLSTAACIACVVSAVNLLRQLSHLPKSECKEFMRSLSIMERNLPEQTANFSIYFFFGAKALQVSILYEVWVAIVNVSIVALGLAAIVAHNNSVVAKKDRWLVSAFLRLNPQSVPARLPAA